MSKYIQGTYTGELAPLNVEFQRIAEAVNSRLDRSPAQGQANSLTAPVDMNNNRLYNVPPPENPTDVVRLQDVPTASSLQSISTEAQQASEEAQGHAENAQDSAQDAQDSAASAALNALQLDPVVKTSTFTASSGFRYLVDTSGGAFNMNLPTGSSGAQVGFVDVGGALGSNPLNIPYVSDNIIGLAELHEVDVNNLSAVLLYSNVLQGWTYV